MSHWKAFVRVVRADPDVAVRHQRAVLAHPGQRRDRPATLAGQQRLALPDPVGVPGRGLEVEVARRGVGLIRPSSGGVALDVLVGHRTGPGHQAVAGRLLLGLGAQPRRGGSPVERRQVEDAAHLAQRSAGAGRGREAHRPVLGAVRRLLDRADDLVPAELGAPRCVTASTRRRPWPRCCSAGCTPSCTSSRSVLSAQEHVEPGGADRPAAGAHQPQLVLDRCLPAPDQCGELRQGQHRVVGGRGAHRRREDPVPGGDRPRRRRARPAPRVRRRSSSRPPRPPAHRSPGHPGVPGSSVPALCRVPPSGRGSAASDHLRAPGGVRSHPCGTACSFSAAAARHSPRGRSPSPRSARLFRSPPSETESDPHEQRTHRRRRRSPPRRAQPAAAVRHADPPLLRRSPRSGSPTAPGRAGSSPRRRAGARSTCATATRP